MISKYFSKHNTDFFTDRIFRVYTVILFLVLAALLKCDVNSIHDIIQCTEQDDVGRDGLEFACTENDLFLVNGYSMQYNKSRTAVRISSLRELPVYWVVWALFFTIPWVFWNQASALICNLPAMVEQAKKYDEHNVALMIEPIINEVLQLKSALRGWTLITCQLLVKLLYCLIGLLHLMKLGDLLDIDLVTDRNFTMRSDSDVFPQFVWCEHNDLQYYCNTPIYGKVVNYLVIIRYWLLLVVICKFSATMYWVCKIALPDKLGFIREKIPEISDTPIIELEGAYKFAAKNVTPGMIHVLEVIEENASVHVVRIVVEHIWKDYTDLPDDPDGKENAPDTNPEDDAHKSDTETDPDQIIHEAKV